MINEKVTLVKHQVQLTTPQSYEYDSSTQSVVLLPNYVYNIYYSNDSKDYQEVVDLTEIS